MRTRKKKWTARELAENPRIIKNAEAYTGRLTEIFGNDGNPVHMELGCGKGRFIIETALRNPGIHYIAVERDPTILAAAARLAGPAACSLFFVELDAAQITEYFRPGDISRLYINFCDPWPNKKKWAKRRLTHENYLKLYEQLCIPEIHFKTDNRLLFEFSVESFSCRGWRIRNVSLDLHSSDIENIKTEYEEKFSNQGMTIYRLEAYCI